MCRHHHQAVSGRRGCFDLSLYPGVPTDGYTFTLEAQDAENSPPPDLDLEQLERKFWRSIQQGPAPVYGADSPGTLFNEDVECGWNVDKLDSVVSVLGDVYPASHGKGR